MPSSQSLGHQLPGLLLQCIPHPATRLQLYEHGDTARGLDQVNFLVHPQQLGAIDEDIRVPHDQKMQAIAGIFHDDRPGDSF